MGELGQIGQVELVDDAPGVIITGGTKGIGFETCRHFAAKGFRVSLCGRNSAQVKAAVHRLKDEFSVSVYGSVTDISQNHQVKLFAEASESFHGPITNLICNAAILGPVGRVEEIDLNYFSETFETNVLSTVALIQAFWSQLKAFHDGRIVCISGGGLGGSQPLLRTPAYVSSKAATVAMVETLSLDLFEKGITINAIAPGSIPTDFLSEALRVGPDSAGDDLFREAKSRDGIIPKDSLSNYFELLDFVLSEDSSLLTGRLLSARWDPPKKLRELLKKEISENIYRLRRIDEDLFGEN